VKVAGKLPERVLNYVNPRDAGGLTNVGETCGGSRQPENRFFGVCVIRSRFVTPS
jgi:hypothetical protein